MWRELFNGGWKLSGSWWSHLGKVAKYKWTGNLSDDPLLQYIAQHPERLAEAIANHLDDLL